MASSTVDIFQRLPPELNVNILCHMPSFQDLQIAISSSPALFQVYLANKRLIVLNWLNWLNRLNRDLGTDNLMDVLTVALFSPPSTIREDQNAYDKLVRLMTQQWLDVRRPSDRLPNPGSLFGCVNDFGQVTGLIQRITSSIDDILHNFNTVYTALDARLESSARIYLCGGPFMEEDTIPYHSIMDAPLPYRWRLLRPFYLSRIVLMFFLHKSRLSSELAAQVRSRIHAIEGRVRIAAWQILISAAARARLRERINPPQVTGKRMIDTDLIDLFHGHREEPLGLAARILFWMWPR